MDGVGDYTSHLSKEFVKLGHEPCIIALNDRHIATQSIEKHDHSLSIIRFGSQVCWKRRTDVAREQVEKFCPDWVSLQYVSFGFHDKGMPFFLPKYLSKIGKGKNWHVMFHELWYGEAKGSSFKESLLYLLQRSIIRLLLAKLKPLLVHTHIDLFMERLRVLGASPILLPLFGNIPIVESPAAPWGEVCPLIMNGSQCTLKCGVFGSVPARALSGSVLSIIDEAARHRGARAVFIHFGEMGGSRGRDAWENAMRNLPQGAEAVVLGSQTADRISAILQHLDLGIATTPPSALGKSGTFAAMREHGLPVVACAPDFFPVLGNARGSFPPTRQSIEEAISMPRVKDANALAKVARQFAGDLERAAAGVPQK
jgi:hypothetical protein